MDIIRLLIVCALLIQYCSQTVQGSGGYPSMVPLSSLEVLNGFQLTGHYNSPQQFDVDTASSSRPSKNSKGATLGINFNPLVRETDAAGRVQSPLGDQIRVRFQVQDADVDMVLHHETSLFSKNARVTVDNGNSKEYFAPSALSYSAENGVVTILPNGQIDGLFFHNGDAVHIQPSTAYLHGDHYPRESKQQIKKLAKSSANQLLAYKQSSLPLVDGKNVTHTTCGVTPDMTPIIVEEQDTTGITNTYKPLKIPKLARETDRMYPPERARAQRAAGMSLTPQVARETEHMHPIPEPIMDMPQPSLDTVPSMNVRNTGKALLLKRWKNCFQHPKLDATSEELVTIHVAFAVDYGAYMGMGGERGLVLARLTSVLAQIDAIYKSQLGLTLQIGDLLLITEATSTYKWSHKPRTEAGSTCPYNPQELLSSFSEWRHSAHTNNYALVHLITNCFPPPGTVGLAWTGTTCGDFHGSSWSNLMANLWLVMAHEIAHNLGGVHQSEGILSYGSGILSGTDENPNEYGFNVQSRRDICSHLSKAMKETQLLYGRNNRVPLERCYSVASKEAEVNTCGNFLVDENEECDAGPEGNACCTPQCTYTKGSTCAMDSSCCQNCQALPTMHTCDLNGKQGYCSLGSCVPSKCYNFAGTTPCMIHPTNPCREKCTVNGRCVVLGNDPLALQTGSTCPLPNTAETTENTGVCGYTPASANVPVCLSKQYKWERSQKNNNPCKCDGSKDPQFKCTVNNLYKVSQEHCENIPKPTTIPDTCIPTTECPPNQ